MDKEMMVRMVEGGCPFAKRSHMRVLEVGADGRVTMILDDDPANLNAFGLVHAGAICGLMETAGGMAIFNYLQPSEHIVLNTVFNVRYSSMPRGELRCTVRVGQEEVRFLAEEVAAAGRADKALDLKVFDSSGKMVAEAQATYRMMPTPEEFKGYFGG
jgi:acyl-coenzyme A thioesterase PaaI-like protein